MSLVVSGMVTSFPRLNVSMLTKAAGKFCQTCRHVGRPVQWQVVVPMYMSLGAVNMMCPYQW